MSAHGTNPAVRKLPYDAIRDFTLIAMSAARPTCWSSHRRCQ
jgi:hypothetical protein